LNDAPGSVGAPPRPRRKSDTLWTRDDLERVRARDPLALASFFEAHIDWVYGLVFRLLGSRESAEDVTQEIFYRLHRGIDRLDPGRNVRNWLIAVACNACRDHWRLAATRAAAHTIPIGGIGGESDPYDVAEEIHPDAIVSPADPEEATLRRERERIVQSAIGRLVEDVRVPLVLHEYEGLSHEEIARTLGISSSAARKRYSRALAALARELKGRLQ
jgi:RNA polymerase sigma-70 factor (ECF subfamily)